MQKKKQSVSLRNLIQNSLVIRSNHLSLFRDELNEIDIFLSSQTPILDYEEKDVGPVIRQNSNSPALCREFRQTKDNNSLEV